MRIVIVEDHLLTRVGLRMVLEKADPELEIVGEAEDGESAVLQILDLDPDVVLLDIGLPVKDGLQVTKEVKLQKPNLRIVILTSHDGDGDVRAALTAGANGYCLKTTSGKQLASAIRSVSTGAVWLDPGVVHVVLGNLCSNSSSEHSGQAAGGTDTRIGAKFSLSLRELEVLSLIVEGLNNHQIADSLIVSPETIKTHVRHILEKLLVKDRTQAAVLAVRTGLVVV